MCCKILSLPITLLARLILNFGIWPECWRLHCFFPLFKKRSKMKPGNYRGIHLTPQISKVMERVLGKLVLTFLDKSGALGENQFAYRRDHSFMDVLALNVVSWIIAFGKHRRVALYCSDVSGAFDRVDSIRFIVKLKSRGVHPVVVDFL